MTSWPPDDDPLGPEDAPAPASRGFAPPDDYGDDDPAPAAPLAPPVLPPPPSSPLLPPSHLPVPVAPPVFPVPPSAGPAFVPPAALPGALPGAPADNPFAGLPPPPVDAGPPPAPTFAPPPVVPGHPAPVVPSYPAPVVPTPGGPPVGYSPGTYRNYSGAFPEPAHTAYYGPTDYAGFGQRLVAMIVDQVVVGAPSWVLSGAVQVLLEQRCGGRSCTASEVTAAYPLLAASIILPLLTWFFLVVRPTGRNGKSIGCRVAGISVVDMTTGKPVGAWRVVGRQIVAVLSGCLCYAGYFAMLFSPKRQTWHDAATSVVVVRG